MPLFDIPLLALALRTDAAFVGAMGSRRTHDDRMARLRDVGLTEIELARLSSPIGLDLGTQHPAGDGDLDRGGDHRLGARRIRSPPE